MTDAPERVQLDRDAALVLYEMLTRDLPQGTVRPIDSAEQRALWNLEAALEGFLPQGFLAQYGELLAEARARLRGPERAAPADKTPVAFFDVDGTLVAFDGPKRVAMHDVVARVRDLYLNGFTLFCWSSAGAAYAYRAALELRVSDCFAGFLPKPNVVIDGKPPAEWRGLVWLHPGDAASTNAAEIAEVVKAMSRGGEW